MNEITPALRDSLSATAQSSFLAGVHTLMTGAKAWLDSLPEQMRPYSEQQIYAAEAREEIFIYEEDPDAMIHHNEGIPETIITLANLVADYFPNEQPQ